jgi:hypothetical protein
MVEEMLTCRRILADAATAAGAVAFPALLQQAAAAVANLEAAVAKDYWLADGKQNLFRNLPNLYQAAAEALREVGTADIRDPESYYTNQFVDQL